MAVDFEPYSNDYKDDPYPIYRQLRDEAPVHFAPHSDTYTISRHADVQAVLTNTDVFRSKNAFGQRGGRPGGAARQLARAATFFWRMRVSPWRAVRSRMLIMEDGDVHRAMRNRVNRGFTPRRILAWEARILELVEESVARIHRGDRFDLVEDLAIPLPVTIIAEMLGVEPERQADFKRWSDAIIAGGTGSGLDGGPGSELLDAMGEMKRYLGPIVRARRAEQADDLISVLASEDERDAALTDHEIFMFFLLLLVAGNETTTNLIGNAVDALLEHPDELARVAEDPSLVPSLVEEALRFDTPVQFIHRIAVEPTELHGVSIPKGGRVLVLLGSANRDERHFADPDRFDVGRDTRGHVGFGYGAHFCLGASLARLEAKAALEALVRELPSLVRVTPEREFLDSYLIRGRARLELQKAA